MEGLDPGVVDMGRRGPRRGVGIKLGVVRPPLGVGKRLRLPEDRRLFVGSEYMFGEEEDIERTPFKPLEPLGGREAPGFTFLALGVFRSLGKDCSRLCLDGVSSQQAQPLITTHTYLSGCGFLGARGRAC